MDNEPNPQLTIPRVSGSITVSNATKGRKQVHSNSNWFTEEYYTIKDDGQCLLIKKHYLEIPKNAIKLRGNNSFGITSDIDLGRFEFDEESTEDELVVYYR